MEQIQAIQLPALFSEAARLMQENEAMLCALDAEMGDGDLGLTMRKGFCAMPDAVTALLLEEQALSKVLMKAGMKMASVVPSTMGTLMGSGIMGGGKALLGRDAIDGEGLALFLGGFAESIAKRGKCQVGDRTILDAIDAAARDAASCESRKLCDVAEAAYAGAQRGREATKAMLPKFGKAAVFSAKAVGRIDQGAVAGALFVQAIRNYVLQDTKGA